MKASHPTSAEEAAATRKPHQIFSHTPYQANQPAMKHIPTIPQLRALAFTSLAVLSFTSCVQNNRPYWTGDWDKSNHEERRKKTTHNHIKSHVKFEQQGINSDVIVIEFDDQGDFWDRTQMNLAIQKIRKTRKQPLLITYVHGWHNNSKPKCRDLEGFRDMVQKMKADKIRYRSKEIIGVYIGWRGESLDIPGLRQLTFWNRSAGASNVADGSIVYALHRLGTEARGKNDGRSVLVGHSFGGRIVEKAVSQSMIAHGQNRNNQKAPLSLPADFIALINPATESLRARQLQISIHANPSDTPTFVAIGAKNDFPTSKAWPAGAYLKGIFGLGFLTHPDRRYRLILQNKDGSEISHFESQHHDFIAKTTTNNPVLFSHQLNPGKGLDESRSLKIKGDSYHLSTNVGNSPAKYRIPNPNPKKGALAHYGYWIFQVPTNILDGHSNTKKEGGIFSEEMQDIIKGLIQQSEILKPGSPRGRSIKVPAPEIEFKEPTLQSNQPLE
ncbi:MAG: hypothetical protein QM627_04445 [Luteolibacter sp.]